MAVRPEPLAGERLATVTIWLLAVCCFLYLIQLYVNYERGSLMAEQVRNPMRFDFRRGVLPGNPDEQGRFERWQDHLAFVKHCVNAMAVLMNIAYWPTALVYLAWLYQASKNLRLLQVEGISHTPGWAVACYFVPIANLFRPCVELQEIWRASDPVQIEEPFSWQKCPPTNLIRFWWMFFLASCFFAYVAIQLEQLEFELEIAKHSSAAWLYCLANLGMLPAGPLLILIIRGTTQRQRERYARLYEELAG